MRTKWGNGDILHMFLLDKQMCLFGYYIVVVSHPYISRHIYGVQHSLASNFP